MLGVSQKTNLSKKDLSLTIGVSDIGDSLDSSGLSATLVLGLNTPAIYSAGLLEQLVIKISKKSEYIKFFDFILLYLIYSLSA